MLPGISIHSAPSTNIDTITRLPPHITSTVPCGAHDNTGKYNHARSIAPTASTDIRCHPPPFHKVPDGRRHGHADETTRKKPADPDFVGWDIMAWHGMAWHQKKAAGKGREKKKKGIESNKRPVRLQR
jgi:hypothetical protein